MMGTPIKHLQFPGSNNVYDIHAITADSVNMIDGAVSATLLATQAYVQSQITDLTTKGVLFKGEMPATSPAASLGDVYVVGNTNTTINNEITCDPGDMWFYTKSIAATPGSSDGWIIVQANINREDLDNSYASATHKHTVTGKTEQHVATVAANSATISVTSKEDAPHTHNFTVPAHDHTAEFQEDISAGVKPSDIKLTGTYDKITGITFDPYEPAVSKLDVTVEGKTASATPVFTATAAIGHGHTGQVSLNHTHNNAGMSGTTVINAGTFTHSHGITPTELSIPTEDSFALTATVNDDTLVISLTFDATQNTTATVAESVQEYTQKDAINVTTNVTGNISYTADDVDVTVQDHTGDATVTITGGAHTHDLSTDVNTSKSSITFTGKAPAVAANGYKYTSTQLDVASTATTKIPVYFNIGSTATTTFAPIINVAEKAAVATVTDGKTVEVKGSFNANQIKTNISHDHTLITQEGGVVIGSAT